MDRNLRTSARTPHQQAIRLWRLVAQLLAGIGLLTLLTLVCLRPGLGLTATGFIYLMAVVLLSLWAEPAPAIVLAFIASGFLAYFFAEQLFSFRLASAENILSVLGFLVTSLLIAGLVGRTRRLGTAARSDARLLHDLDRVNRAIQATDDLERMMSLVLDTLLSIFDCDRAWLVYPCDPEAAFWRATMESTRPEFPGAFALHADLPMDADIREVFGIARRSSSVVRFGPGSEHSVPMQVAERFGVKSFMGVALYPKVDRPYMLGLHQCSRPRVWTLLEERLLQEIGRRLTDALTSLLIFQNLRESEAKLEQAQRIARVGYWERDIETHLLMWSDETYRIYGVRKEAGPITPARFAALIHPEDRTGVIAAIEAALSGGQRYDQEFRVLCPGGETRFVHSQGDIIRDETGQARRFFGAAQDITGRKRAEEALRESEEQWRAVFINNPTMYFMMDEAGAILSVNPFGAEHLGYAIDELVGRSVLEIFHEADRVSVRANAARCLDQLGQLANWEARKVRKDGTILWVRETARAMRLKDKSVLLVACEDITEAKRADYMTRQLAELSPDRIWVIDRDYRIRGANPVCEKKTGIASTDLIGKHFAEVIGKDAFNRFGKRNLDRCFGGGEVRVGGWLTDAFGRRYAVVTHSPLRPDLDRVEAALVISRDITDHVQAADALREAEAELARVNRVTTMGQLTASIAHEVSQPIAATVTNARAALRWLASQPPDLREVQDALCRIVRDGHRAGEIIDGIRSLVKKSPPRNDPVDMNETILEVIALVENEMLRHGIALRTKLSPHMPRIEGDRVQFQQVMLNLIMNAIEAMSPATDRSRNLLVATDQDDAGNVRVLVRDSGPGLSPQAYDSIFDAFYSTKLGGIGMGLSICRSIIEAHGGRIRAAPNEPRGADFEFTVPIHRETTPKASLQWEPGSHA